MTASTTRDFDWDGYVGQSIVTGQWFGKAKRMQIVGDILGFVHTRWHDTKLAAEEELFSKIEEFETTHGKD